MLSNHLRQPRERLEADPSQSGPSLPESCMEEVYFCQAQANRRHQFNFPRTLLQQLQTSGFSNNSFLVQEWQRYQRDNPGNPPNLATLRSQFLEPFVDAISNLAFPAGQRNGRRYQDFRTLVERWARCQTLFNNQVMHQFTPQQRQLLQNHDWLHLTQDQRNQALLNVPALRQLAQNQQARQNLIDLPSFTGDDAQALNRLVVRRADAPGGQAPAMTLEERQLRRGVEAYISSLPNNPANNARRDHLRALLNRAPGDRSVGDNMELTVYSLIPYIRGANAETFNRMATFALWSYLRTQPNGLTGALSPELRTRLQIHSDNPATRDVILNLVDAARNFPNSANFNADMTTYATAIGLRNMPPHPR
ncbi:MAG: hypothetical protein C5B53_02015 [Candidatus Melainabacteria bacterium]|nr:MAG: hypothetical protein C5B53_02015 [Candidatus Melainabacteria bacterium]